MIGREGKAIGRRERDLRVLERQRVAGLAVGLAHGGRGGSACVKRE